MCPFGRDLEITSSRDRVVVFFLFLCVLYSVLYSCGGEKSVTRKGWPIIGHKRSRRDNVRWLFLSSDFIPTPSPTPVDGHFVFMPTFYQCGGPALKTVGNFIQGVLYPVSLYVGGGGWLIMIMDQQRGI